MVKRNEPVSPQPPEEQQPEDWSRAHPVLRNLSQVEELLDRHNQRKKDAEFQIKELDEWKTCINAVASTPNGRMLLRSMLQFSGVLNPPPMASPNQMVTNTIKGAFYLTWIRPYLNPDVRKELE